MTSKTSSGQRPYIFRKESNPVPTSWDVKRYEDIVTLKYGNNLPKKDRVDGEYPVYGSNGITGWHKDYHVEPPGIIVGRKGTLEATWSEEPFNAIDTAYYINQECINSDKINLKYLFYNLESFDFQVLESGSAVPSLSRDDFYNERIAIPPKAEQEKIAKLLDDIDTKIEVNNQICSTMEDMARAIFKSWFIDFDPYDNFKDSEMGQIPENFEVIQIGEVCNTSGGGTPNTDQEEYWGGEVLWLTPKEVSSLSSSIAFNTERKLTESGLENTSAKVMPINSTLLYSRGANMGEAVINKRPMATNQGFVCIKPKNVPPHFLFHLVCACRNKIENRAGGSTYPEISQTSFNEMDIVLPTEAKMQDFETKIEKFYNEIYNRVLENSHLEKMRSILLPKLMSGEVRVNSINLDTLEADSEA